MGDQSSCSSQINKMNFKFLLAVFVVAVALMPTPTEARRPSPAFPGLPQIPGSLASLDLINTALAARCRSGTCPTTTTSTALIISGGNPSSSVGQSVEVYVPSTGQNCQLADLPARRVGLPGWS